MWIGIFGNTPVQENINLGLLILGNNKDNFCTS